eukprot:1195441-Prorocentrum_minimum.AAC.7
MGIRAGVWRSHAAAITDPAFVAFFDLRRLTDSPITDAYGLIKGMHQATFLETLVETFHLLSQSPDSSLLRTFTLSVQFACKVEGFH